MENCNGPPCGPNEMDKSQLPQLSMISSTGLSKAISRGPVTHDIGVLMSQRFFPHHMWTLRWRKQSNYCWPSDDHYLALLPSNLCLNNICQAKLEILSDADKLEWVQRSSTEVVSGFHLVPYEGCMTCLQLFPPQRRHQSSLTFTFRIMITVITIVV